MASFMISILMMVSAAQADSFTVIRDGKQYLCQEVGNPQPPPSNCVPKCRGRHGDGTCYSYDRDFCGPYAQCVPKCRSRHGDGTCFSYDADFCGPNAFCQERCRSRHGDGTCYSYDADECGTRGFPKPASAAENMSLFR